MTWKKLPGDSATSVQPFTRLHSIRGQLFPHGLVWLWAGGASPTHAALVFVGTKVWGECLTWRDNPSKTIRGSTGRRVVRVLVLTNYVYLLD